mgnify:CR=1 FL=1
MTQEQNGSASTNEPTVKAEDARDRRILVAVLAINLAQCGAGIAVGLWAGSTALIGAALDNLGDAFVYALGLYAGNGLTVAGEVLPLPRRERRILEYLVNNRGCRVTKSQIFNYVYGLFSEDIDENVVESHISKLRKRLRHRLGYDPIDSQRFLGYRLVHG